MTLENTLGKRLEITLDSELHNAIMLYSISEGTSPSAAIKYFLENSFAFKSYMRKARIYMEKNGYKEDTALTEGDFQPKVDMKHYKLIDYIPSEVSGNFVLYHELEKEDFQPDVSFLAYNQSSESADLDSEDFQPNVSMPVPEKSSKYIDLDEDDFQ
ncbi:hypothetical protein IHI26_00435 [Candidatus Parvarchaeota archaeon]|nr:hypothetical protein [Candidatus Acidifodinimicrobium mancum]MBE5729794.1 hypothetical protein [Candidatus Acidifodinimicrobium mancum]